MPVSMLRQAGLCRLHVVCSNVDSQYACGYPPWPYAEAPVAVSAVHLPLLLQATAAVGFVSLFTCSCLRTVASTSQRLSLSQDILHSFNLASRIDCDHPTTFFCHASWCLSNAQAHCLTYRGGCCCKILSPNSMTESQVLAQAAASSAMEARDKLEEELSEARQAMEAVQQQHDKLAADLQEVTSAQTAGRPEDAARIAQLSDRVSPSVILAPLRGEKRFGGGGGLLLCLRKSCGSCFHTSIDCRVKTSNVVPACPLHGLMMYNAGHA